MPFWYWKTQTFIAALRCDGCQPHWIIDRTMIKEIFEIYIETQLAPTLEAGDVVILDHPPSHKSDKAMAILKEWRLVPLLSDVQLRSQPD